MDLTESVNEEPLSLLTTPTVLSPHSDGPRATHTKIDPHHLTARLIFQGAQAHGRLPRAQVRRAWIKPTAGGFWQLLINRHA